MSTIGVIVHVLFPLHHAPLWHVWTNISWPTYNRIKGSACTVLSRFSFPITLVILEWWLACFSCSLESLQLRLLATLSARLQSIPSKSLPNPNPWYDYLSCASWAKNGFCTNPGYTKAYLQQYVNYIQNWLWISSLTYLKRHNNTSFALVWWIIFFQILPQDLH